MATHHIAKVIPSDFKRIEQISKNLIELLDNKDFSTLCFCDPGDSKYGVPPVICDIHELAALVEQIRHARDTRHGRGRRYAKAKQESER